MSDAVERKQASVLTRRQLLLLMLGGLAAACRVDNDAKIPLPAPTASHTSSPSLSLSPTAGGPSNKVYPDRLTPTDYLMSLGEETAIPLTAQKIRWTPDLHLPYVGLALDGLPRGGRRYFISGNAGSFRIDLRGSLYELRGSLKEVSAWSNYQYDQSVKYRNGYAAVGGILQTDPRRPAHLLGVTHNEDRASGGPGNSFDDDKFTASIGLIESQDGGVSWQDRGQVIVGDEALAPGTRATGAGQPCAIVKDRYAYVYYIDWAAGKKVQHPDQIYLARSAIQNDGSLSKFEYLTKTGFSPPGARPENLEPAIPVPGIDGAQYAALPSVSYNTFLKQYLCVFETNVGFCAAKSDDGIKWGEAGLIAQFPQPHSARKLGNTWYSYPSLLSDQNQPNDQLTDREGILYCSKGTWQLSAHGMTALIYRLK